jgi:uncharacterized protein (DUF302 family)
MGSVMFRAETPKGIDAAAEAVQRALAARGFGVLWAMDVNDKLQEKGFSLDDRFRILEVCNPARAKEALETNPLVVQFLPCKVTLYERAGRTEIGLPLPSALIGLVADERLRQVAVDVEQALVAAVREAAG